MDNYRKERLEQAIQEFLSLSILQGKVKDPRVKDTVFTKVTLSKDCTHAKIYIMDTPTQESHLQGLHSAAGFLQSMIAQQFRLRRTPRLHFFPDTALHASERTLSLLESLNE